MMSSTYEKTFIPDEATPAPKRIIVCCDGTWQSSTSLDPKSGCPSNVTRLCRTLANAGTGKDGRVWQQLTYYDAGIGTGDITDVEKKRQGGMGYGLVENVIEAYNFITLNYNAGDELFFFGFSRGAYTVRAAAGLVGEIGVIKPATMPKFIKTYYDFTKMDPKIRPKSFNLCEAWANWAKARADHAVATRDKVTVKVVGVWDTVGSLGIPDMGHFITIDNSWARKAFEFHDTELNDRIEYAYQALALDERRRPFRPCVWKLTAKNTTTHLVQCWFAGAHVNVGGGSSDNVVEDSRSDNEGDDAYTAPGEQLASISYAWMIDRIRPHLALDSEALERQLKGLEKLADGPPAASEEAVRDAGYATQEIRDSHTALYDAMGLPEDRMPGRYHDPSLGQYTVETVHPSVHYRQVADRKKGQKVYEPAAMRGWKRVYEGNGKGADGKLRKGWMWVKYKDDKKENGVENQLWEAEIGRLPMGKSVEWRLIEGSWVDAVHQEVAKGWRDH